MKFDSPEDSALEAMISRRHKPLMGQEVDIQRCPRSTSG